MCLLIHACTLSQSYLELVQLDDEKKSSLQVTGMSESVCNTEDTILHEPLHHYIAQIIIIYLKIVNTSLDLWECL